MSLEFSSEIKNESLDYIQCENVKQVKILHRSELYQKVTNDSLAVDLAAQHKLGVFYAQEFSFFSPEMVNIT